MVGEYANLRTADKSRHGALVAFFGALFLCLAQGLWAAELRVLIDSDRNSATGCTVATANGAFAGVEQVLNTTVNTTVYPPVVGALTRQSCLGGVLEAPVPVHAGGWPVGLGLGSGGYDVVETFLPVGSPYGRYRLGFTYQDAAIGDDALTATPGGAPIVLDLGDPLVVPALSQLGLALLSLILAGAGLYWLRRHRASATAMLMVLAIALSAASWAAIVLDGLITDWSGVAALSTDPLNDAPPGVDLAAAYAKVEVPEQRVYFRADVKTASPPIAVADTYGVLAGASLNQGASPGGLLANDFTGAPPGSISSFGGGSLGGAVTSNAAGSTVSFGVGGSLTVIGDGSFSYTPATGFSGSFSFNYRLSNSTGSADALVTFNVNEAPAFTSAAVTTFTVGTPGSFTPAASGFPVPNLNHTGGTLPSGLGFTANTGPLAGTPAAGTVGTHNLQFTAHNGIGVAAVQAFVLTIQRAGTTSSVTSSVNPAVLGQSITLTATVTTPASGAGTPTGNVTFYDGASALGTVALNGSGQASLSSSALSLGAHSITVQYAGDANFLASTSAALSQNINQAATTSSVASNLNPSTFGQTVTFTATVSVSAPGVGTPTGSVSFRDGATVLGSGTLNGSGQATFGTAALTAGAHSITVLYAGDANFQTSTSGAITQTVNQASTGTALTSSVNPSVFGQSTTLTATVSAIAPGAGTPTGTVEFRDGATVLGSGTLNGSGVATLATSALSAGSHTLSAVYAGDSNFLTSTSSGLAQTVNAANTGTTVVSGTNPSLLGNSVTFTATVIASLPGGGTPSGNVNFSDGVTPLGTGSLNGSGQAIFATSGLSAGSHSIVAAYQGSSNHNASSSAILSQVVNQPPTAVADSYNTVHDTLLNVPAGTGLLSNDGLGVPAVSALASATGNGAACSAFPCTLTSTANLLANNLVVNADGSFSYTPPANYAGADGFSYGISNAGGSSSTTVTLSVSNALPVADLNGGVAGIDFGPASFTEGGAAVAIVDNANLTVSDADSTQLASATVTITNLLDGASESLAVTPSGAILAGDIVYTAGTGTLSITRLTTLADYQAVLRTLMYNNGSANPTTTQRDISVAVFDLIGSNSPLAHALVDIAAVNTAPVVTAPASRTTSPNTPISFPGTISVTDADAGAANVQVTLTAINGTATLSGTAGLTVLGNGTASVISTGSIAAQNTALNGLQFSPDSGFSGAASLQVALDDLGNTGSGGALTDSETVSISVNTPPTVSSTNPVNGATPVAQNATIGITFSESVNASLSSFTLECPGGSAQSFTLSASPATTFTLTPSSNLPEGSCAVGVIAANVTDVDVGQPMASNYNFSFTVDVPPTVSSTVPTNGATEVLATTTATFNFSKAVTVSGGSFSFSCSVSGAQSFSVAGSGGTSIVLTPAASLPAGETCTVTALAAGVVSALGTPMAANYPFAFTIDTPPTVNSTTPANAATNVALASTVVFNFSKAVNLTGTAFSLSCSASGSRSFTQSGSGTAAITLTPSAALPPGETCTATALATQIASLAGTNMTANHAVSFDTTIVVSNDTYPETALGNVSVDSANVSGGPFTVLANDTICASPTLSLPGAGATAQGGNVSMTLSGANAGRFTYNPPPGYTGDDTFTYNVTCGSASATATVTVPISGMIWFVDNNAASCTTLAGGCGRLSNPFSTLGALAALNDGTGNNPAAGDNIFIYESATDYTGPLTLLSNQKLIGQDASTTLAAIAGVSPPASATALPILNSGNATKVNLSSAGTTLTLNGAGTANTLRGFTLGNAGTDALSGTGFGTLTLSEVSVNTNARALSLATGTLAATVDSLVSTAGSNNLDLSSINGSLVITTGAMSGATGNAFNVSGGTANLSYAGTIASGSARSVAIASKTGGTVTLSGAITDTDTGISLTSNTGSTINLTGQITANTGANAAFTATGGGTVTATNSANTLNTTTATALNVTNTTIGVGGLVFQSITSNGGSATGIILDTTGSSGGLTVNGDGSNTSVGGNGSGGTIANKSGADGSTSTGIGIYLNNTRDVVLRRMNLSGTNGNFGIKGLAVTNFTLQYSTVSGTFGSAASLSAPENYGEGSIYFGNTSSTGLTGTGTFTNNSVNGGRARNLSIVNTSGTANLTIKGNTFGLNQNFSDANQSLAIEARNSGTIINSTVGGVAGGEANTFSGSPGDLANFTGQTGTTMDVDFLSNTLTNTHAQNIIGGGGLTLATQGSMTFSVDGNTMSGAHGSGITLQKALAGTLLSGSVNNNVIGQNGVAASGSATGNGIFGSFAGTGTITLGLTNNTVRNYEGNAGMYFDNTDGSYTANFTITGNTVSQPGASAFAGLALTAGAPASSDTIQVCAAITANDMSTGDPFNINDIIVGGGASGGSALRLPGYAGSTLADVENFIRTNNLNSASTTVMAYSDPGPASIFTGGAACPTP